MAGKSPSSEDLGVRMKENYEYRTRYFLPRRTYTLIRVDGRSFHAYTRGCARPFDLGLMEDMDSTAIALCAAIEGAVMAFVQSDEISLLLTDFASRQTEAWFDGSVQKICSLSASIATGAFNLARQLRREEIEPKANTTGENPLPRHFYSLAQFDSRVWTIPDPSEVYNYFVWRQQDATRNSISMAAQAQFSHAELQGVSGNPMQELLWTHKGINWNDYPAGCKRGRMILRQEKLADVSFIDRRTGEEQTVENVVRHSWQVVDPPDFTGASEWLKTRIPSYS